MTARDFFDAVCTRTMGSASLAIGGCVMLATLGLWFDVPLLLVCTASGLWGFAVAEVYGG